MATKSKSGDAGTGAATKKAKTKKEIEKPPTQLREPLQHKKNLLEQLGWTIIQGPDKKWSGERLTGDDPWKLSEEKISGLLNSIIGIEETNLISDLTDDESVTMLEWRVKGWTFEQDENQMWSATKGDEYAGKMSDLLPLFSYIEGAETGDHKAAIEKMLDKVIAREMKKYFDEGWHITEISGVETSEWFAKNSSPSFPEFQFKTLPEIFDAIEKWKSENREKLAKFIENNGKAKNSVDEGDLPISLQEKKAALEAKGWKFDLTPNQNGDISAKKHFKYDEHPTEIEGFTANEVDKLLRRTDEHQSDMDGLYRPDSGEAYICNEKSCKVHNPNGEKDSGPSAHSLQWEDKKFRAKVNNHVRGKVLSEALNFFDEAEKFWSQKDLVQACLTKIIAGQSYNIKSTDEISEISKALKNAPKGWDNKQQIAKFLKNIDAVQIAKLFFFLTFYREGYSSYQPEPQDGIIKLAEKYTEIDYPVAFAQAFFELAPDEFKDIAKNYLQEILKGNKIDPPGLWWTDEAKAKEAARIAAQSKDDDLEDIDDEDDEDIDENDLDETSQG